MGVRGDGKEEEGGGLPSIVMLGQFPAQIPIYPSYQWNKFNLFFFYFGAIPKFPTPFLLKFIPYIEYNLVDVVTIILPLLKSVDFLIKE